MGILSTLFGSSSKNENLEKIIADNAFLVDVRSNEEFQEGHVNGSVNIPLDQISRNLSKFKSKNQIVVFCRSGMRSSQAKSILNQNGFTNVTNGGTWKSINDLVSKQ